MVLGVVVAVQPPSVPEAALTELAEAQQATEQRLGEFVAQWTAARDALTAMQEERAALGAALEARDGDVASLRAQVGALEARIEKQLAEMQRLRASARKAASTPAAEPDAEAQRQAALRALGLDELEGDPDDRLPPVPAVVRSRPGPPAATIRTEEPTP